MTTTAPSPAKTRERPVASLAEVLAAIRAHEHEIRALGATALYVFGSAARDELGPESDVDVYIDYDPAGPFSFVELLGVRDILAGQLGRNIDLGTRNGLNPRLRQRIEASSIRVL